MDVQRSAGVGNFPVRQVQKRRDVFFAPVCVRAYRVTGEVPTELRSRLPFFVYLLENAEPEWVLLSTEYVAIRVLAGVLLVSAVGGKVVKKVPIKLFTEYVT